MKKLFAMLLLAMLAMPVTAETPIDPLPYSGIHESSGETIEIVIDGERLTLEFDASPLYSSVEGGVVQASYYKYSDGDTRLYEMYLIFPETAQAGMVITPEYSALTNEESSVVLIASDTASQKETYYFSSLMSGRVYPEESDYAICLDAITENDGATTYSGRLSATLIALDMASGAVEATLVIEETPFSFTLNGKREERHSEPLPTPLPEDMMRT